MGLKIEYIVLRFVRDRSKGLRALEPLPYTEQDVAIERADRFQHVFAGILVLEQHVDRKNDIFNEPEIVWKAGALPEEVIDAFAMRLTLCGDDDDAEAIEAA